MRLIETYAASSGLQIGKPFIYTKFFSIPWDKYLVLHAGGGMISKRYDYYAEVVELIKKALPDYEVIQIGDNSDPSIPKAVDFRGKTTIHQTAYILEHASLLIGNDSCNVHIASYFDIPIVALYGSTTIENHGPSFSSPEKIRLLAADLGKNKPSYSTEEYPKTINSIKPELVAQKALELLGKDISAITRQSLFFGHQYNFAALDILPNCLIDPNYIKEAVPTVRMDYLFNEDVLGRMLSIRPCRIITNQPINLDLLRHFKSRIPQIVYDLPIDYSVDFVKGLRKLGLNFSLTSLLKGNDLAQAKLDCFDYHIVIERENAGDRFIKEHPEIDASCKFKTNKFLLSSGKIYLSKAHWLKDISVPSIDFKEGNIEMSPEFFDFSENLYIYKE
jgi:glycosyl transferase family 9 (putative heptosyltransferase)